MNALAPHPEAAEAAHAPASLDSADERVLVTLTVAGQLCGIPVLAVRDVLDPLAIARTPLAPPDVAGSLNLRGRIVTAIDLRRRLGLPAATGDARPMSVVVEQGGELYSLQVDRVGEVLRLPEHQFEENPPTLDPRWRDVSTDVCRLKDTLLAVLDVARLLDIARPGR